MAGTARIPPAQKSYQAYAMPRTQDPSPVGLAATPACGKCQNPCLQIFYRFPGSPP